MMRPSGSVAIETAGGISRDSSTVRGGRLAKTGNSANGLLQLPTARGFCFTAPVAAGAPVNAAVSITADAAITIRPIAINSFVRSPRRARCHGFAVGRRDTCRLPVYDQPHARPHVVSRRARRQLDHEPRPPHPPGDPARRHRRDDTADVPGPVTEDDIDRIAHEERVDLVAPRDDERLTGLEWRRPDEPAYPLRRGPRPPHPVREYPARRLDDD